MGEAKDRTAPLTEGPLVTLYDDDSVDGGKDELAPTGLGVGISLSARLQSFSGRAKHVSLSAGHPSPDGHAGLVAQLARASV